MKNLFSILGLFIFHFYFNQNIEKQEFKVKGNCNMCKSRIEQTAQKAGANSAHWDLEHQILELEISTEHSSFDKILKQIAEAGHDNERYTASEETYNNLPACCLYERENTYTNPPQTEYQNDKEKEIESVNIIAHKSSTFIGKKEVGLVFNIGEKELLKAACCNLSESFETNSTVDVSFSNAITGGKQLKMLGLDQKYTSLTKSNYLKFVD